MKLVILAHSDGRHLLLTQKLRHQLNLPLIHYKSSPL